MNKCDCSSLGLRCHLETWDNFHLGQQTDCILSHDLGIRRHRRDWHWMNGQSHERMSSHLYSSIDIVILHFIDLLRQTVAKNTRLFSLSLLLGLGLRQSLTRSHRNSPWPNQRCPNIEDWNHRSSMTNYAASRDHYTNVLATTSLDKTRERERESTISSSREVTNTKRTESNTVTVG